MYSCRQHLIAVTFPFVTGMTSKATIQLERMDYAHCCVWWDMFTTSSAGCTHHFVMGPSVKECGMLLQVMLHPSLEHPVAWHHFESQITVELMVHD
jgi:hypothetical protein